jgi:hypothetical protein
MAGTITRITGFCLVCASPLAHAAAIGLTVSPTAITNDYVG